jgi:hypothetical protein
MDLKTFVAETLVQICEGVKDASAKAADHGAFISPAGSVRVCGDLSVAHYQARKVESVEFDVALTVDEKTSTGGKIGIMSSLLNLNAEGKSDNSTISVSRVKFRVPVLLPEFGPEERPSPPDLYVK